MTYYPQCEHFHGSGRCSNRVFGYDPQTGVAGCMGHAPYNALPVDEYLAYVETMRETWRRVSALAALANTCLALQAYGDRREAEGRQSERADVVEHLNQVHVGFLNDSFNGGGADSAKRCAKALWTAMREIEGAQHVGAAARGEQS
jgi:hypothetical protein